MGYCEQASALWPPEERPVSRAVCMAESGGNPLAYNGRGERSRGLYQINGVAHPQWDHDGLFDPATNAQAAYELWSAQGWRPWSAYTVGTYRRYLDGAEAADGGPAIGAETPGVLPFALLALGALLLLEVL